MLRSSDSRRSSRKVPTNLSLRASLVRRAKTLGVNLSEVLDAALEEVIRQKERESWLDANREGIAGYNARVSRDGVFSDGWRSF